MDRADLAGLGPSDQVGLDVEPVGEVVDIDAEPPTDLEHRRRHVGVDRTAQVEELGDALVERVGGRWPTGARVATASSGQLRAHATSTKSAMGANLGSVSTTARSRRRPLLTR